MCVNAISCLVTETVLVGAVPTEIGQLAQLKKLNLGENQLIGACTGNSLDYNGIRVNIRLTNRSIKYFKGRIPTELGRCSALSELDLWTNKLTGTCVLCSWCPAWYTSLQQP